MFYVEENGRIFETATAGIHKILDAKKETGKIPDELVQMIVRELQANLFLCNSYEQRETAGAAMLISSRTILPKTDQSEKLALIPLFEQGIDLITNFDRVANFKWTNIAPLFHMYLESIPEDSPGATRFLVFLIRIFDVLNDSPNANEDLYSYNSALTIARVVHVTMDLIVNEKKDLHVRKLAVEVLYQMIRQCPQQKAPAVSLFVSGLLSKLVAFLKKDSNADLTESCLNLFTDSITLVFADNSPKFDINQVKLEDFHPEMHCVFLNQTEKWRTEGADNIFEYINEILLRYMLHRVSSLRTASTNLVMNCQMMCPKFFGERMYIHLLFLYKQLRYDDFPEFQEIAVKALELIPNRRICMEYFYTQLDTHITKLPCQTRAFDGGPEIDIISALLSGIGEGVKLMCTTGSETIERLLRSLADSVVINPKGIMITTGIEAETPEQAIRKMKLMHDISHSQIQRLCEILAKLGGVEIIDMVHNLMRAETAGKQASYHIILGYLLSALDAFTTLPDDPIILMLAEYLVKETNRLCVVSAMDDSKPTQHQMEIDWDTCVESLSLTNVALCMKFIGRTDKRSQISISCLCTLLMQTTSVSWIVRDSAYFALKLLADQDQCCENVIDLVHHYDSHILHVVSMACSSMTNYLMGPILLKGYLKHADVMMQFDATRIIVEKLLYALDMNNQEYCYSIVLAISLFMDLLVKVHPNLQPLPPPEDSEDDKPLPTPQHIITENILKRTKHLLTSDHLAIQVTVLRMISYGLILLKNYDDMLLPMIHQHWFGIMVHVRAVNPVTLPWCIDVIVDMADFSGSFVHNKVLKEFWPCVEDYFLQLIRRFDKYEHSLDYANATKIISVAPHIVTWAGLTEQEAKDSILKVLEAAIEKTNGPFVFYAKVQQKLVDKFYHQNIRVERNFPERDGF
ncbi:hypothetical protein CAEBREN_15689 [Caenorhabditis brenneri]|uniref:TTI1 C-terminal TPR domain-containing protein n=1 Tax=Caenorhabditis brenneri TaxID=135651 RepID=G0NS17_CAEBE|nr:hypothetical protein CAEBREN_15689 [Caenorhabditis brenneri]